MKIIFANETDFDFKPLEALVEKVALESLKNENFTESIELSFSVINDEQMRKTNLKYRNVDSSTDVLSFPLLDFSSENIKYNFKPYEKRNAALGDIVINIDRAQEQAEAYGHSLERETAFLTAHSMLHLLGYDHIENKCEEMIMFDKQEKILDRTGLHREHGASLDDINIYDRMVFQAYLASSNSYSPYSGFAVGACALCEEEFITGCNIENSSYPAGICAERTAIFKAISEGKKAIRGIAIYSNLIEFTYPCGICLQVMSEFMADGEILAANRFGKYKKFKLSELLTHGFKLR